MAIFGVGPQGVNRTAGAEPAKTPREQVADLMKGITETAGAFKSVHTVKPGTPLHTASVKSWQAFRRQTDRKWLKVAKGASKAMLEKFDVSVLAAQPTSEVEATHGQLSAAAEDSRGFFARNQDPSRMTEEDRSALPDLRSLTAELNKRASQLTGVLTKRADSVLGRARAGREMKLEGIAKQLQRRAAPKVEAANAKVAAIRQKAAGSLFGETHEGHTPTEL